MQRSEIRGTVLYREHIPDFASLHPGYKLTLSLNGRVRRAHHWYQGILGTHGAPYDLIFPHPSLLVPGNCNLFDTFNPLGLDFKH